MDSGNSRKLNWKVELGIKVHWMCPVKEFNRGRHRVVILQLPTPVPLRVGVGRAYERPAIQLSTAPGVRHSALYLTLASLGVFPQPSI